MLVWFVPCWLSLQYSSFGYQSTCPAEHMHWAYIERIFRCLAVRVSMKNPPFAKNTVHPAAFCKKEHAVSRRCGMTTTESLCYSFILSWIWYLPSCCICASFSSFFRAWPLSKQIPFSLWYSGGSFVLPFPVFPLKQRSFPQKVDSQRPARGVRRCHNLCSSGFNQSVLNCILCNVTS